MRLACIIGAERYPARCISVMNPPDRSTRGFMGLASAFAVGVRVIGVGIRAHFFVSYHAIYETLIECWSGRGKKHGQKRDRGFRAHAERSCIIVHASSLDMQAHVYICMCVCMYMYTYICTEIHMYGCICAYMCTGTHTPMYRSINRTFAFPSSTVVPPSAHRSLVARRRVLRAGNIC